MAVVNIGYDSLDSVSEGLPANTLLRDRKYVVSMSTAKKIVAILEEEAKW